MTPEEVERELKKLNEEGAKSVGKATLRIFLTVVLPWLTLLTLVVTMGYNPLIGAMLPFALLAPIVYAAFEMNRIATQLRRRVEKLTATDDVRIVGTLLNAQTWLSSQGQSVIQDALIRLLPRLKTSDRNLLTPAQLSLLSSFLSTHNPLLILAQLKALEQIGDEKAIPNVERLLHLIERKDPEITGAAQQCLEFLIVRAEELKAERQLLRASSADTLTTDLLRPSTENKLEFEELLRVSQSPD